MIDLMSLSESQRPESILQYMLRPAMQTLVKLGFKGSIDSRVEQMLLTISGQEADFKFRDQQEIINGRMVDGALGPALGLLQFEKGTMSSRGGVSGVMLHASSRVWMQAACAEFKIAFDNDSIWRAQKTNDLFAFITGRLLLFTDPYAVPTDVNAAWTCYAQRLWRPGKPHPSKWPGYWKTAQETIKVNPFSL